MDESLPEEESQRIWDEVGNAFVFPFTVIAARGMEPIEAEYERTKSYYPATTMVKLGEADGYLFYLYDSADEFEDRINAMRPENAEECRRFIAALREAFPKAEFFAPVKSADPYFGMILSFETTDLDGNPVKSEELFAGSDITMLNIWATWCDPCKGELEELGELDHRLQELNCRVIGILSDGENDEAIAEGKAILAERHADYLNLTPSADLRELLDNVEGIPLSLMVNESGFVMASITGAQVTAYEPAIRRLLSGEKPEEAPAEEAAPNPDGYRVIVLDADGAPVEGVTVQFCSAESCLLGKTDASGVAVFDMPGGEVYTVHILKVPQGFEKHTAEYETKDYPSDLTVTIKAA